MPDSLKTQYAKRRGDILVPLANELEKHVADCLKGIPRIDQVRARAKDVESFIAKAAKTNKDGKPKYDDPLNEIQDQVGARIVTFFRSDVPRVEAIIKKYFTAIESKAHVPETEWSFGYFGHHDILTIPSDVIDGSWDKERTPRFFELQIKTLFQHAWSEAEHDIGYKPGEEPFVAEQERKLAFTSAQAWGADQIFEELWNARGKKEGAG
jgi:ppGpp synthetase/RelA/SpoT-type nucleotidyltranferase